MSEILTITWLSKQIAGKFILENIDFSIREGEVVSLIGPSGGGKTSIIRTIGGLEPFDAGEIRVGDAVIRPESEHGSAKAAREYIGMAFQEYNIWSHMTVLENVMKPLILTKNILEKEAREIAMNWLKKVRLEHKANAYPKNLSGGQKQRVAIARALATSPKLLLLDEITSALDPELTQGILNLINILAKEGTTMLIITHHMEFARQVSDRILFVDDGKIIEETKPDDFFSHTANGRIKQFLASMQSKTKDITVYEGVEEFQSYWLGKLNMLPQGTTGYVLGAVGNRWFETMGKYYEKHEQMMIRKKMHWKMVGYDYTEQEKRAHAHMGELFEMRIIPQDTKPLANFNIWGDTLMIQIFDGVPKIIEIRNIALVESYMSYFELMWEMWEPV